MYEFQDRSYQGRRVLAKKNADDPEYKYNLFQLVLTAILKTIMLRPKMNDFIANGNMYRQASDETCRFLSMGYKKDILYFGCVDSNSRTHIKIIREADTITSSLFTITYYLIDKFRKRRVKSEE